MKIPQFFWMHSHIFMDLSNLDVSDLLSIHRSYRSYQICFYAMYMLLFFFKHIWLTFFWQLGISSDLVNWMFPAKQPCVHYHIHSHLVLLFDPRSILFYLNSSCICVHVFLHARRVRRWVFLCTKYLFWCNANMCQAWAVITEPH